MMAPVRACNTFCCLFLTPTAASFQTRGSFQVDKRQKRPWSQFYPRWEKEEGKNPFELTLHLVSVAGLVLGVNVGVAILVVLVHVVAVLVVLLQCVRDERNACETRVEKGERARKRHFTRQRLWEKSFSLPEPERRSRSASPEEPMEAIIWRHFIRQVDAVTHRGLLMVGSGMVGLVRSRRGMVGSGGRVVRRGCRRMVGGGSVRSGGVGGGGAVGGDGRGQGDEDEELRRRRGLDELCLSEGNSLQPYLHGVTRGSGLTQNSATTLTLYRLQPRRRAGMRASEQRERAGAPRAPGVARERTSERTNRRATLKGAAGGFTVKVEEEKMKATDSKKWLCDVILDRPKA